MPYYYYYYYFFFFLKGIKEGWYDGGSIAFAVILVIVVTGIEWNASLKIFIFYYIRG